MNAGDVDVLLDDVDAGHVRAELRHRLRENAAAAADVEHGQALEWARAGGVAFEMPAEVVADIGKAQRVQLVQGPERALAVPPGFRELRVELDLARVDGRIGDHVTGPSGRTVLTRASTPMPRNRITTVNSTLSRCRRSAEGFP